MTPLWTCVLPVVQGPASQLGEKRSRRGVLGSAQDPSELPVLQKQAMGLPPLRRLTLALSKTQSGRFGVPSPTIQRHRTVALALNTILGTSFKGK